MLSVFSLELLLLLLLLSRQAGLNDLIHQIDVYLSSVCMTYKDTFNEHGSGFYVLNLTSQTS